MPQERETPKDILGKYISDTLISIRIIEDFCDKQDTWCQQRQEEVENMRDIKENFDCGGYKLKKSMKTFFTGDNRHRGLEKKLGNILESTLSGLKNLEKFLTAVEKVAATSVFAFTYNQHLPKGKTAADICSFITAARMAVPLVIHFKRDNAKFFVPSLSIVEILALKLETYMEITNELCEKMEKRENYNIVDVRKYEDVDVKPIQKESIHDHLNQLIRLRNDEDMRLTLLFKDSAQTFIEEFDERHARMQQFLSDIEEEATKLDNMKYGANISSVAGSSVGLTGGVLTIVGLALTPVTLGASLALTITGVGLGVTSGVNSVVTSVTESNINAKCEANASVLFNNFMQDMQELANILELVAACEFNEFELQIGHVVGAVKAGTPVPGIVNGVDKLIDAAEAVKAAKAAKGVSEASFAIGKVSRSAVVFNALFIGVDAFFICRDSVSLAKGRKSEIGQDMRSRVDLWRSELDSWERIRNSLDGKIGKLGKTRTILNRPFRPSIVYKNC